jgi:hypothetical protein
VSVEKKIFFNRDREHWTGEVLADNQNLFFLFFIGRWYYEKNILSL